MAKNFPLFVSVSFLGGTTDCANAQKNPLMKKKKENKQN